MFFPLRLRTGHCKISSCINPLNKDEAQRQVASWVHSLPIQPLSPPPPP